MKDRDLSSDLPLTFSGEARSGDLLRPVIKGAVLLGVLLACLVFVYLTPLRHILREVHVVCAGLQEMGFLAPLAFMAGVAVLVAIGCPRLILCPIGGLAFGFWQGLLWTQIGTLVGFYATFLFVRWGGREFVEGRYPRLAKFSSLFEQSGFSAVVFLRLLPIAGFFVNILLGLTRLRHRNFFLGTVAGIMPEAVPATLIGSSTAVTSLTTASSYISIAILALVLVWMISGWYVRYSRSDFAERVRRNFAHGLEK